MTYDRFPFPWHFFSWTNGTPHHSGFKFQTVALFLIMCVVLGTVVFCREFVEFFPGIVSRYFLVLWFQFQWPQWLLVWCIFIFLIRWISSPRFLYCNLLPASFCINFLSDGIATSVSKQILRFVFTYHVWSVDRNLFVLLNSAALLHLHVTYRLRYIWISVWCCDV
jgi:hypothetical protein